MQTLNLFFIFFVFNTLAQAQFIKVANTGKTLPHSAPHWDCVLDDKTGLLWEVKKTQQGLQNTYNTYTWFDGKSGTQNGEYSHHCHWGKSCNTRAFISALNIAKPCQTNTWRLPRENELNTLLRYHDNNPLINTYYFPNTQSKSYWTQSELNSKTAIDVPFFYGGTKSSGKSFDSHIRAVSDVN